jgi:hypothetical protein
MKTSGIFPANSEQSEKSNNRIFLNHLMRQKLQSHNHVTGSFLLLLCVVFGSVHVHSQSKNSRLSISTANSGSIRTQFDVIPLSMEPTTRSDNGFRQLMSSSTGITFTNKLNTELNPKFFRFTQWQWCHTRRL